MARKKNAYAMRLSWLSGKNKGFTKAKNKQTNRNLQNGQHTVALRSERFVFVTKKSDRSNFVVINYSVEEIAFGTEAWLGTVLSRCHLSESSNRLVAIFSYPCKKDISIYRKTNVIQLLRYYSIKRHFTNESSNPFSRNYEWNVRIQVV